MTQPKHITPDELDELVAGPCDCPACSGTRRAAATIRALLEERDAANARAANAEADLAALRAETADLREVERCIKSVWAAGVKFATYTDGHFGLRSKYGGDFFATFSEWTVSRWQQAERAAWWHAAEPYRERCKSTGWPVLCITPRGNCGPITIEGPAYRIKCFGKPYGSPTLDALEQAAKWAEEHPADAPTTDPCASHSCAKCCTDTVKLHACIGCEHGADPVLGECRYTPTDPEGILWRQEWPEVWA